MKTLEHIGLAVQDMDRSVQFYTQVLDCKVTGSHRDERINLVFLQSGTGTIELVQYLTVEYEPRNAGPVDHLAFKVENMEEEFRRLQSLGVKLLWDTPKKVLDNKKAIFFFGPDGERLEFIAEEKF